MKSVIDWHSHILPGVDDGSRNVTESLSMLKSLSEQGVGTVVATPHFYANSESIDDFLIRRKKAFEQLCDSLTADSPRILLGAEVKYYPGVGRLDELKRLCIGESKLLLLEMPMCRWTEYTLRELREISSSASITIVLAHIERYINFQSSAIWDLIVESDILVQTNADFFLDFWSKRKALSFLKEHRIQFIGSDCHNMTDRAPRIGEAYGIIEKKFGKDYVDQINEYGYTMLMQNK